MKKSWILRNPDPVEGEQGNAGAAELFADEGAAEGSEQTPPTQTQTKPTATQPTGLSKEDVTEILKQAQIGQPVQQTAPQEPTLTPAEFDKMFNVTRADETIMRELFEIPDDVQINPKRVERFNALLQGVVRQAVSMSAYQTKAVEEQLAQRFNPALEMARQRQEEQLKAEFFKANEDLKEYEPLLVAVKDRLVASGFKGSKEDAFKRIAEETRAILKTMPGLSQTQSPAPTTPSKPASKMSTVTSGGQGGSGGGKPTPKSGPAAIFS